MTNLERGYRRLLALYPRRHRAAYEAEMLAALLTGARPGQRSPRRAEVLDLIRGAFSAHTVGRPVPAGWSAAAGAVGTIGAIGMSASVLRGAGVWHASGDPASSVPAWTLALSGVLLAVWPIAALAAVAGWRGIAATAATLGLAGASVVGLWVFGLEQVPIGVVAALLTAGGLVLWAAARGPVLRGVPLWATVAAGAIGVVTGWIPRDPFAGTMPWLPVEPDWQYGPGAPGIALVAVATVLLVAAMVTLPERARALLLASPFVALVVLRNGGLQHPSTLVVLCLLAAPFVGLALARVVAGRRVRPAA